MKKFLAYLTVAGSVSAVLVGFSSQAMATPCPAPSSCVAAGVTFTETGGTSNSAMTFLASFDTGKQSPSSISSAVLAYLNDLGYSDALYLGRNGDPGVSITGNGNLTGTWTFTPSGPTADYVGGFVAIHAGGGTVDNLYAFTSPGVSGNWATLNGHGISNFDLFGIDPPAAVPEPLTISLFGAGLVGAMGMRRRRKNKA
jgi:hypothetical protein